MGIRFLDVFCKVFEKRSFSRAADELYLTQPTVSSHIKSLEDEFDVVLFDRLGREVVPTSAGELLYKYASEIERLGKEAREALDQFTGKLRGRLEIGGSTIPGEYLLPDIIGRFRKKCPEITSTLHIGDTREITEMVIEGKVNVGMVGAVIEDRRIENFEYATDELILIASSSYPHDSISGEDMESLPFILRESGSGSRAAMERAIKKGGISIEQLNIVAEMGSTEAVKTAVKSGLGLSIVSTLAVKDELEKGPLKMVKVKGLPITRKLYVITHAVKSKSPLLQAFLKFITSP